MKSALPHPMLVALAFLAAGGVGWLAAGRPPGAALPEPFKAVTSRDRSAAGHHGNSSEGTALMSRIRQARNASERLQATVELAGAIPAEEIGAWLKSYRFDLDDGPEKAVFTGILKERWFQSDPAAMMDWCITTGDRSVAENLSSWAVRDPEAVMTFMDTRPGSASTQRQFLGELSATHPEEARSYLKSLLDRKDSSSEMGPPFELLRNLAAHDPAGWQELTRSFPSSWQPYAKCAYWTGRLDHSFDESVAELANNPESANLSSILGQSPELLRKMADRIESLPKNLQSQMQSCFAYIRPEDLAGLSDATLQCSGMTAERIANLRIDCMPALAGRDPEKAVAMMGTLDLTPDQKRKCLNSIVGAYASNDEKAAELIASLPSEEDRQVAQEELEGLQKPKLPCSNLPEWLNLAKAGGKEDPWSSRAELARMDSSKLEAFDTAFNAMTGEDKLKAAMNLLPLQPASAGKILPLQGNAVAELIRNADEVDSQGYPLERRATLAAVHADDMAREDPAAGAVWMAGLPKGKEKEYAQIQFYKTWRNYSPDAARAWLGTLTPEEREAVSPLTGIDY